MKRKLLLFSLLIVLLSVNNVLASYRAWGEDPINVTVNGQPCVMYTSSEMWYHTGPGGKMIIDKLIVTTVTNCDPAIVVVEANDEDITYDANGAVIGIVFPSCNCEDCGEWDGCAELRSSTMINTLIASVNYQLSLP